METSEPDGEGVRWSTSWGEGSSGRDLQRLILRGKSVPPLDVKISPWERSDASTAPYQSPAIRRARLTSVTAELARKVVEHFHLKELAGAEVESLSLSDRYVRSPLAMMSWAHWVAALLSALKLNASGRPFTVQTARDRTFQDKGGVRRWEHDFPEGDREEMVKSVFRDVAKLSVQASVESEIGHARRLTIRFTSGKSLQIWLDHGMGFVRFHDGGSRDAFLTSHRDHQLTNEEYKRKLEEDIEVVAENTTIHAWVE